MEVVGVDPGGLCLVSFLVPSPFPYPLDPLMSDPLVSNPLLPEFLVSDPPPGALLLLPVPAPGPLLAPQPLRPRPLHLLQPVQEPGSSRGGRPGRHLPQARHGGGPAGAGHRGQEGHIGGGQASGAAPIAAAG